MKTMQAKGEEKLTYPADLVILHKETIDPVDQIQCSVSTTRRGEQSQRTVPEHYIWLEETKGF